MASIHSIASTDDEDTSSVSTPVVSSMPPPGLRSSYTPSDASSTGRASPDSSPTLLSPQESNSSHLRLPIPTPSANRSQSSFAFADVNSEETTGDFDDLPPEIASADISIAPDGSFVETSSATAARELKKRYDRHLGVGKDVRSPYAITAFVNQHGKQMFRVGHRDQDAPAAAAAAEIEQRTTLLLEQKEKQQKEQQRSVDRSPESSRSDGRRSRRSRMSIHAFMGPAAMFPLATHPNGDFGVPPPRLFSHNGTRSPPTRKLRKARSNPQLSATLPDPSSSSATPTSPTPVGRMHSHSVTGADLPRLPSVSVAPAPQPRSDVFSDVMKWKPSSSSLTPSLNSCSTRSLHMLPDQCDIPRSPAIIPHPFGAGVMFDSPLRRSGSYLASPPVLREMQSFESGLTARADTPMRLHPRTSILSPFTSMPSQPKDSVSTPSPDLENSPSTPIPSTSFLPRPEKFDPSYMPTMDTSLHTQYSTEVFDVLQTYRGLPLLDRISPDSTETTVIKMSVNPDDSASPRDDPRFVIWAELAPDIPDDVSVSQGSQTNHSSSRSAASRRRSNKGRESIGGADKPAVRVSAVDGPSKALVAATIERWIAQLTSELNYDELLVFFLTYRTYISAVDLCHLLICRFHWALGQHVSEHDEMVRRIVRVRTFVAIRYWLLTFFAIDFIPSRELRLLLASWLNTLKRDPILKKHNDATNIVGKLISVVQECKEVHTRQGRPPATTAAQAQAPESHASSGKDASTGEMSAETPASEPQPPSEQPFPQPTFSIDSDLDLDFIVDESNGAVPNGSFDTAVNPQLTSQGDRNRTASVSLTLLQQPLHQTILQHRQSTTVNSAIAQTPATLPVHHNALSRALVNTIGRLGRWKRVLQSRSSVSTPAGAYADVSAFDLELTAKRDLLMVKGGVEQYLKMIDAEAPRPVPVDPAGPSTSTAAATICSDGKPPAPSAEVAPAPQADEEATPIVETVDAKDDGDAQSLASVPEASVESEESGHTSLPAESSATPVQVSLLSTPRAPSSAGSSGSSSYGVPISPRPSQDSSTFDRPGGWPHSWQPEVVSVDELDLSDTSSEMSNPSAPPGLKKPARRLPLRRDFEFVDRNRDSVSSMGLTSHESITSGQSSAVSSMGGGLGSTIQQWQVDALVDSLSDDDEAGDVVDALRRLEGHMNPQKQRQKASKVDQWVKTMRSRIETGDHGDEEPRYSSDLSDGGDEDEDEEASQSHHTDISGTQSLGWYQSEPPSSVNHSRNGSTQSRPSSVARVSQSMSNGTTTAPSDPTPSVSASTGPSIADANKPPVEDAVPLEILQSRVSVSPAQSQSPTAPNSPPGTNPTLAKFGHPAGQPMPRSHRSFVHGHSAAELAQHFSVIDRELFLGVKFEELTSDEWRGTADDANILDWGQFLRERARWKAEGRSGAKTSALVAARGRFNLVANFVLSEIVLTHPAERPALVGKFIRIAWKCYTFNNFATLVAIIAGLHTEWVQKAMHKSWHRVNVYNVRMLKDLAQFVDSNDDFVHMRNAVDAMADWKPAGPPSVSEDVASNKGSTAKSKAGSEPKPQKPPACVPFLGIYLSQLHRFGQLPDLIDPTAPNEAVGVDAETGNFNAPAHPEVFATLAPLPPAMQLEPLINVQKQRLIAGTIKALVAGQHLASRVQFPVDRKLFQRCLKLRGLDEDTLQRAFAIHTAT
ncbi:ras GEF [Dentipellis sp. KUC8613]|nr:ras GEF [Dentipellis sp. KUC8613]